MAPSPEAIDDAFRYFDLTGVVVNAVLGGMLARKARLDLVGFGVLAVLSGLGGGMIRDTLLQRGTPAALTDYAYLFCALAGAVIAYLVDVEGRLWDRVFPFLDALALGCWAAAGSQKTLEAGLGWLPAVLLGTITAVGGGTVRDVILRRTPGIFGGPLYATSALVASGVMVVLDSLGLVSAGLVAATVTGAGLTLLARWRNWQLPQPRRWKPVTALAQYSDDWFRRGRARARHGHASGPRPAQPGSTPSDDTGEQP